LQKRSATKKTEAKGTIAEYGLDKFCVQMITAIIFTVCMKHG